MNIQEHSFEEAKRLALLGEDFGELVGIIDPEQKMSLRVFVCNLPEELAKKTIYGKVALTQQKTVTKSRGRPRNN